MQRRSCKPTPAWQVIRLRISQIPPQSPAWRFVVLNHQLYNCIHNPLVSPSIPLIWLELGYKCKYNMVRKYHEPPRLTPAVKLVNPSWLSMTLPGIVLLPISYLRRGRGSHFSCRALPKPRQLQTPTTWRFIISRVICRSLTEVYTRYNYTCPTYSPPSD